MTSAADVREMVESSGPDDWIPFQGLGTWTYSSDVSLRIVENEQLDPHFQAPWTAGMQGGCASLEYLVYYGESPVEYHNVVAVDDYRAFIPMPQEPANPNAPYTITPYQETLGQIVTGNPEMFTSYLNQTGIQVQGQGQG